MIYPKIPLAQSIVQICLLKDIQNIVISPGSRNAPLTIGFTNNAYFDCYSITDERCAAFFALGIAQQTRKPVAIVCTSGSALLNYYPAFAEAFYSQIPLIVISADRPADKIDIGDGQTIRQENVFSNHSLYNANLTEDDEKRNNREINNAINCAMSQRGPVHINAPFEEPLYKTSSELSVEVSVLNTQLSTEEEGINPFANIWNKTKKKLILVGENPPNELDQKVIDSLAKDPSVVVMTETTSNIHHSRFINNIDTIITPFSKRDFEYYKPEILLTFGGMIVSKRIKTFIREHKPCYHWHIDTLRAYDTFDCLTNHIKTSPNIFFNSLYSTSKKTTIESDYNLEFQELNIYRKQKHFVYVESAPFSDLKVFEIIIQALPKYTVLQVSNSASIRYMQLFDINSTIEVYCNRGTSGIDGCTSTAIGAAVGSRKQTVFITGDISFFYDSNALWNNYIPKNFKIILINNGGGGIFRILPGHEDNSVFETYFETQHRLTAKQLAEMYGLEYRTANDEKKLKTELDELFIQNEKPIILEIFTPTAVNSRVLLQYFEELL